MSEEIEIPSKDGGVFKAYVALPHQRPAPAVIVIQEIFGINPEMREKCNELARQGFIAVCPDLFWRMEPGVQLTDKTEEEWKRAFQFFQDFDINKGIEDLRATAHVFKGHADCTGNVGCVGYCLGGKLAYLMAARSSIDCSVSYYGVGLGDLLGEAPLIKKPLMLHVAEKDEYVRDAEQKKIKDALKKYQNIKIHSYPGVNHAFARGGGVNYDLEAAIKANDRTFVFLKSNLKLAMAA
ncbi:MAG: dienelactone hydrolase family protein [Proteobacteria bacterium]|nr:dienelactone hydrolase family protein [Pseudomonadota bacterium]